MTDVDCMACIANEEAPNTWPTAGGPRPAYGRDGHGVSHAFVRSEEVSHRGWWKCDFERVSWTKGEWIRSWHPAWDI